MAHRIRLLRVTTVPISLKLLLKGQPKFFKQQGFEVLTVSADGPEVADIKSQGIAHRVVPMTRAITPWHDLKSLWLLIKVIRAFKPDIIHTHTPKAGLIGMLAGWICRVPVRMHTIAGLVWIESAGLRRWILKRMEWLTYFLATAVYPNSNAMAQLVMRELNFSPAKTKVIGSGSSNGIEAGFFNRAAIPDTKIHGVRSRLGIAPDDLIFCFIGRIVRDKGIVELVQAFEQLNEPKAWLLLVGHKEPDLDPLPTEILQKIGNNKQIIEVGFQTDVRPWLAASDVFVFPSYREGFPNVVMQAACMELPCIVTDINGCNEIIQHDQTGLIIPSKDEQALWKAMQRIMMLPDRGGAMGVAARAFVVKNFDQQVIWSELLKEYSRHF